MIQTKHHGQVALAVWAVLFIQILQIVPAPNEMDSWSIVPYLLDYSLGPISRGLLGTILKVFFPFLGLKLLWGIVCLALAVLVILTGLYCEKLYHASEPSHQNVIAYLIALFCVNPAAVSFLANGDNYGRMETYMLIAVFICSWAIVRNRQLWLVPILSGLCMLLHQKFVFLFFPVVLCLLLSRCLQNRNRYTWAVMAITLVSSCALFLYMQLFSHINIGTCEELVAQLQPRTDMYLEPQEGVLQTLFYSSFSSAFGFFGRDELRGTIARFITIGITLVLLLPLGYIFRKLWKDAGSQNRFYILYPIFILVCILPTFLLTIDNGRDIGCAILSLFVLTFSLYRMNDAPIRYAAGRLAADLEAFPRRYLAILVWLAVLSRMGVTEIHILAYRILIITFNIVKNIF